MRFTTFFWCRTNSCIANILNEVQTKWRISFVVFITQSCRQLFESKHNKLIKWDIYIYIYILRLFDNNFFCRYFFVFLSLHRHVRLCFVIICEFNWLSIFEHSKIFLSKYDIYGEISGSVDLMRALALFGWPNDVDINTTVNWQRLVLFCLSRLSCMSW